MNSFQQKIKVYIEKELLTDKTMEISDSTSLIKSGFIDSIDIMRLITFLEELGFMIENDEYTLEHFDSIEKIMALLSKKQTQ